MIELANEMREQSKQCLRFETMFNRDLIHRYPYIRIEQTTRERIKKRLTLDLATHPQNLLARRLMLQVEAQHVYCVLRSTIASQKNDPFVQALLRKYMVDPSAEVISMPPKLLDLAQYKTPIELGENSKILQEKSLIFEYKYVVMAQLIAGATIEFVDTKNLFEYPVSRTSIIGMLNSGEFPEETKESMDQQLNTVPLKHLFLLKCEQNLFNQYNSCLQYQWLENIRKNAAVFQTNLSSRVQEMRRGGLRVQERR